MDRTLPFFSIAVVAVLAAVATIGHASSSSSSEDYWETVLPNTPMPDAIRDRLHPDLIDEKDGTSVDVGKGGVHVDTRKQKGGTNVDVGKGGVHVDTGKGKSNGGTTVGVGRKGVGVDTGKGNTRVNVGNGGVNVNTGGKGKKGKKPVIVNVKPGKNPFFYKYEASADELKNDPNVALFFLEKDLHPGTKLNVFFPKATPGPAFLPRSTADAIPFSSAKFSEIFRHYSIDPKSQEAELMKATIKQCEEPAIMGETKFCATSLESMIDFTTSKLGTQVRALETNVEEEKPMQQYTIATRVHKVESAKSVACHGEAYVHAVYYCHESADTSAYTVPLIGQDGTKVDAIAVCHKNTSQWNPKHMAFQVLKVKPGSVPVCHFIPEDHIVWVQN